MIMPNYLYNEEENERKLKKVDSYVDSKKEIIIQLFNEKVISGRFGKYLISVLYLEGYAQKARIFSEAGDVEGAGRLLAETRLCLDEVCGCYLTNNSIIAFLNGNFSRDHKELIDWAIKLKNDAIKECEDILCAT